MREGWATKKLESVCKFQNGFAFKSKTFRDSGTPVVRITNIQNEIVDLSKVVYVERNDYDKNLSRYEIVKGDLLIAMSGATTGKIGIHKSNEILLLNQRVGRFAPSKNLSKRYLFYYLIAKIEENLAISAGAAQPNLSTAQIKSFQIPCPPIQEQKQIVALLDQAFTAIDQAKANIERNIENAKELFQSKLNAIFSQKGEGWEEKTLGQICENLDKKRVPITKSKRIAGDVPYYGASGIVDYVKDYLFDEELLLVSEDGANLLARTYPIAFSIGGKTWVNNHAHALRFENMTHQIFTEFYLNSIKLDDYVSGMAQPKLNQRKLKSIPVPFPETKTQKKVVSQIQKLKGYKDDIDKKYHQKLESLGQLKKSILQKAFSGELSASYGRELKRENLSIAAEPEISHGVALSPLDLHIGILAYGYKRHKANNSTNTFGHVKMEKLAHMAESRANIELGRKPYKDAAGPNDFNRLTNQLEPYAEKMNYFRVEKRPTGGYDFIPKAKLSEISSRAISSLSQGQKSALDEVLDLMVNMKKREAELFATVYTAWNNLLIQGEPITDEAIVLEARENWHPDKLKISRPKFFDTLEFLRRHSIIPKGQGKLVQRQPGLFD